MTESMLEPALPIILLNGYLGAGKTTYLNQLLAQTGGRRIAVLVNDFGSINVDAGLIEGAVDGVVALQDGCICCSMAAGMQKAIYQVLKREPKPEFILIEASGVSNPAEIGRILNDAAMRPYARLEFVVTLLDCEQFASYNPEELGLVQAQVMSADLVLLTKTDVVDENKIAQARQAISRLNPAVLIVDNQRQGLSLDLIMGKVANHDGAQVMDRLEEIPALEDANTLYRNWIYQSVEPLSNDGLQQVIRNLPKATIRGKGEIYLSEYPSSRFMLQMVGKRVKIEPAGNWGIVKPRTQIVFIALKNEI